MGVVRHSAIEKEQHLKLFRNNLQMLCNYDWVPIPLAYPQLVFLAVYVYFAICLISRQFIVNKEAASKTSDVDLTLPFVTMMEFLIFVGWMKVAEGLLNPFGEDDDDFECNFLLDKNLAATLYDIFQTALCIVDEASNDAPELAKDQFWSTKEIEPIYSKESAAETINPLVGSATLSNISGEVDQGTRMVVRKSIDISNGTSSIQHSPSGRTSRKWRLGSIVDRFGSMRRFA
ncbi:unnamed protein product [Dracunculus medinensis]|uniref:Bestrophin homolog n=1 Tax=Dracunculus medinensis TaxID=318479 RepID=A0A0N4UM50_DRAME|nr:unnamed protein product [Dracunculus medinensis]